MTIKTQSPSRCGRPLILKKVFWRHCLHYPSKLAQYVFDYLVKGVSSFLASLSALASKHSPGADEEYILKQKLGG